MNLKLILILSLSHVCIDITGTAVPAIMPLLKEALQLNYTMVGTVIMLSNVTSSIIQPCLGYFSDRMQVRWVLPISVVLTYGGFSLIGLAPSYGILLIFVFPFIQFTRSGGPFLCHHSAVRGRGIHHRGAAEQIGFKLGD